MRTDRLLKLADFLDIIPQEKFNMYRWTNTCGTACCALGWATHIPEFQDAGLKMSGQDTYGHATGSYSEWRYPVYDGLECYEAAAAFFEIDLAWADWLFCARSYSGRAWPSGVLIEEVVDRIRNLASCGGPPKESACSTP